MNSVDSNFTWTGDLLLTSGPWFGTVPFNTNAVTFRKVGTMTWAASTVTGNEEYSPPAFVLDDFSGHYGGGLHQTAIGCSNPAFSGTTESIGVLNITQNGAAITLQSFPTTGGSCSFPGTLTQAGQMGAVSGSYARICVAMASLECFTSSRCR